MQKFITSLKSFLLIHPVYLSAISFKFPSIFTLLKSKTLAIWSETSVRSNYGSNLKLQQCLTKFLTKTELLISAYLLKTTWESGVSSTMNLTKRSL